MPLKIFAVKLLSSELMRFRWPMVCVVKAPGGWPKGLSLVAIPIDFQRLLKVFYGAITWPLEVSAHGEVDQFFVPCPGFPISQAYIP